MAYRMVTLLFVIAALIATLPHHVRGTGCCDAPDGTNLCDAMTINERFCATHGDPDWTPPCGNTLNITRADVPGWEETNFGYYIRVAAGKMPCRYKQSCAAYTDLNTGDVYCDLSTNPPQGGMGEDFQEITGDCPGYS